MDSKVTLNFKKDKIGLALASGGFLGAYELGCIDYLIDIGINVEDFDSIIGTSVGSVLMVSLLSLGFDETKDLFLNIKSSDIYSGDLVRIDTRSEIFDTLVNYFLKSIYNAPKNIGNIALILRGFIGGSLDTTPLKNLLNSKIPKSSCQKILDKNIDIAICTTTPRPLTSKCFTKKTLCAKTLIDYVMASSAAYPVFPAYTIGSTSYIDGGYLDSNNAKYLYTRFHCTKSVIFDLKDNANKWDDDNTAAYIFPTEDLGSFLDTSKETMVRNFNQGYADTKKYFEENVVIIK